MRLVPLLVFCVLAMSAPAAAPAACAVGGRGGSDGRRLARRAAPRDARRRLGLALGDPGASLPDRSRRRRGVHRRRAARRLRRHPRRRYRRAAVAAGDYLLGVAEPAAGGLRWPDWADPDGERSTTHFTSFDDGAAGISDYLWKLYRVTRARRFRAGALAGMRWVVSRAEGADCPETACAWTWTDDPEWRVAYNGVGMGQAGIVLALDAFADRTGDPTFRAYARAGAARLRELTANGTRPLPRGSEDPTLETGFLSGSAGAAYMFLDRWAHDRDPADLATARGLLRWVNDQAIADASRGLSWPISRGQRRRAGRLRARGGGHRVGQPAGLPRHRRSRVPRRGAPGGHLAAVGRDRGLGLGRAPRRPDGARSTSGSTAARPGSAGCWRTSRARASSRPPTGAAARAALDGLRADAGRDRLGAFWYENRTDGRRRLRAEPSWHWGSAGIAAFAARLAGWSGRGPGGQAAR